MAMARGMITRMRNTVGAVLLIRTPTTTHSHYFHFYNASLPPSKSHLYFFSSAFLRSFSHHFPGETNDEGATTDGWEEEDEAEPKIGDGGDGGGVALQNVPWGERALFIAEEVLMQFSEDIKLCAFKTTPRGYVYVRLDKLTDEYGCPSVEELECYNQKYKKRLDEVGALGEIPDDLALEVSSPGAERLLKVPDDISRFKDMPMRVYYTENIGANCPERDGVFLLDSIEKDSEMCVWKLADVKENRDPLRKGRPLSRKQKDWRLKLPFNLHRMVILYLEYL
ncbi:Ribosome maturation factor RimP [Spatholobus suberectus]|nr:Ribosome maturation factor RimP [Spatholobus suberectus]